MPISRDIGIVVIIGCNKSIVCVCGNMDLKIFRITLESTLQRDHQSSVYCLLVHYRAPCTVQTLHLITKVVQ